MYFYYSEEEAAAESHLFYQPTGAVRQTFRRARQAERIFLVSNGFAVIILIVSVVILHRFPRVTQTWADILGVSLAVGACLQWLPQIVTTWRLGHLGSLSPASLCFLAPYTWTFGISMIVRLGFKGWSAWIVYVLVGTMQIVLIGFAIVFSLRQDNDKANDEINEQDQKLVSPTSHTEMSESFTSHTDEMTSLLIVGKETPTLIPE